MEINKQLFEDVLAGKLKGTFVLRDGSMCSGNQLTRNINCWHAERCPYRIKRRVYSPNGVFGLFNVEDSWDIVDFIPDTNMKENELKITIPEGQEIDWQESAKQEKIVFKKKDAKPRSWEEYCEQHNTTVTECYFLDNEANVRAFGWHPSVPSDYYRNTLPSKELAEAFLAMMQLMSLRYDWIHKWSIDSGMTDDWVPDWAESFQKYGIVNDMNNISVCKFYDTSIPLSFPTKEMAIDFMNCFKDLLEVAKPLI